MWRGDRPGPREGCTGEPPPLRTPWGTSGSSACPLGSPRLFFEEKEDSIFYREQAVFLIFVSFFRCNFYLCSDPNLLVRGEVRGPRSRHPFVEGHGAGSHAHSWLKHRPPGRWGPRAPRCPPGSSHTGTDVRVPVKVDLSWRGPRSAGGTLAGGAASYPAGPRRCPRPLLTAGRSLGVLLRPRSPGLLRGQRESPLARWDCPQAQGWDCRGRACLSEQRG